MQMKEKGFIQRSHVTEPYLAVCLQDCLQNPIADYCSLPDSWDSLANT